MRLRPLFKWFGSKWQSARRYPAPRHDAICEPFAGAAGYALNYADRRVVIFDADPLVAELWRWLIGPARACDVLEIPLDVPEGTDIRTLGLSRGQALLLKHWQRTNNVGNCWTVSPWGSKPGQWTANTRTRVAHEIAFVKHWTFADPWARVAEPATWFIDPPYQFNYRYLSALPPVDYCDVAARVQAIAVHSLVICCEAVGKAGQVPSYLPFRPSHESVTSRRKASQSHHSRELIFVREPTP